jgi:hypothetical protein
VPVRARRAQERVTPVRYAGLGLFVGRETVLLGLTVGSVDAGGPPGREAAAQAVVDLRNGDVAGAERDPTRAPSPGRWLAVFGNPGIGDHVVG